MSKVMKSIGVWGLQRFWITLLSLLPSIGVYSQDVHAQDVYEQKTDNAEGVVEIPWPDCVTTKIDSMLETDPLLETSQLGLMVYDLTDDVTLYTYNHQQTMRPASTMKLVTAITTLNHLDGNHQLKTSLRYTGEICNRTLRGNLYCVGGMDPLFDITDLRDFVTILREHEIDTIRGCIISDCSMKDELKWGEGWCWDDDNPTLSALLIGGKANFTDRFISELTSAGVVLDSVTIFEDYTPSDAITLTTCHHNLDQVLLPMMKESNNLYAECAFFQLATTFGYRPARASYARTLEKQLVSSLGLQPNSYRFADGSGLSLYNYVSPELLTTLLRYAWRTPRIYQHLLPTLPIAGEDGTLKKRMKKTAAEGNVKAKTGTLTGIISLAGYLTAANGHELAFTIINQGVMSAKGAREFQDRLCAILCQ